MRKSIVALVVLVFFALSLSPAFAATAAKGTCPVMGKTLKTKGMTGKCPYTATGAKKGAACCPMAGVSAKKTVSAVCPVMGNKIPDVSKAAGKLTYKGKTYYFCCQGCKPKFDKNPESYIKKAPKK